MLGVGLVGERDVPARESCVSGSTNKDEFVEYTLEGRELVKSGEVALSRRPRLSILLSTFFSRSKISTKVLSFLWVEFSELRLCDVLVQAVKTPLPCHGQAVLETYFVG
jgi:hypothetical protein